MTEIKEQPNEVKTATGRWLQSLNPQLWAEMTALSDEQRDDRWFRLTQSHLRDFQAGKLGTEKFKQEELEFLFLNIVAAKAMPSLNPEIAQRGFLFTPERRMEKFGTFGNFIGLVKKEAEQRPFWILVGGIGISGKATLRNILTKELAEKCPHERVTSWDRDYQKIFPPLWQGDINIIEDVHGLDKVPDDYDLVVYALSPAATYRQSLINRGKSWLALGIMDLTNPTRPTPESVATDLGGTLRRGGRLFWEDLKVLRELKKRDVSLAVVDPTEIFKELYGFKIEPDQSGQSFLEALEEALETTN